MAKSKTVNIGTQSLVNIAHTIRGLSMDGVQKANSGHPGLPMGMADVAAVLWSKFLKFNPANPNWTDRDRFVLSGGHGSMLIYSLLHLYGYKLSLNDLKNFRQWGSKTPGHPEYHDTPGVETTTGPLGQGIANAVGMALAESSLAARYNKSGSKVIDHHTYVMLGDGDLEEGISHEACSFAGHNKLDKLIALYDSNKITIDGPTNLSFSENTKSRFVAYGWHVQTIDGHDYNAIYEAIKAAKTVSDKPSMIICKTTIGFGSPNKAGKSSAHGEPLGVEEVKLSKEQLGLPVNKSFYVPTDVKKVAATFTKKGKKLEASWKAKFKTYKKKHKATAAELEEVLSGNIPAASLKLPKFEIGKRVATRAASGDVLNMLVPKIPALIGGSADLTPSNKTLAKGMESYGSKNRKGTYIRYGVREHAMTSIMNGMTLHGGMIPYAGTFFVFTDYMRPAMRLAALMGLQSIYVLTHDSIGLGEDGPTHQPIEHLASLRVMPNMSVIRPMDADETAMAWKMALKKKDGPTCLVLTRQSLPVYNRKGLSYGAASGLAKGAYVLSEDKDFTAIIIATGSEVEIAMDAKAILNKKGKKVRVVSMPSSDLFEKQNKAYKEQVLPAKITKRVAVEAGATQSWHQYVGMEGAIVGIDRFGASAPFQTLYTKFGITAGNVAKTVLGVL